MNLTRLRAILTDCVVQYRKGELVTIEEPTLARPIRVTHVYAMPALSESQRIRLRHPDHPVEAHLDEVLVDVHFFVAVISRTKAECHRAELIELLGQYPDAEELASGPSYIAVGARTGDQGAAMCLFALGKALGLWEVITPATFGVAGKAADDAAGAGYVLCSGWRKPCK